MHKLLLLFVTCCAIIPQLSSSAKILGIFHIPSKSHHVIIDVLMRELAVRGHEVTMISPFTSDEKTPNFTDLDIEHILEMKTRIMDPLVNDNSQSVAKMKAMFNFMYESVKLMHEGSAVQQLISAKNRTFDLMVCSLIASESILGIAHQLDVPVVNFMPQSTNSILNRYSGNTGPYAYVPNPMLPYSDAMTFTQRAINSFVQIATELGYHYGSLPYQREMLQKYYPEAPDMDDLIEKHLALSLLASHVSIESPRPHMPSLIQVGGMHLERPEKLNADLQKILDGSNDNGVIYVSFGSNVKVADINTERREAMLQAFAGRKETILWKFEADLPGAPKNVVVRKWMPQRAVLGHKNVKLFVTHGGLGGVTEAIYNGRPMVCIPFFADQFTNCHDSMQKGYAVELELDKLTATALNEAIDEIVRNKKYKTSIEARSDLFRSQPVGALDKAVFWVEHVAKYGGAPHLRSAATKLYWYQVMLLDVMAAVLIGLYVAYKLLVVALRALWKRLVGLCTKKRGSQRSSTKKDQ